MRNKAECETEERKRKTKALRNLINEKKAELARYCQGCYFLSIRYTKEYDSLRKVVGEQKTLIEKLSNNQA